MRIHEEATLLRIFLGESDRFEGRPLCGTLVRLARKMEIAGVTVLRGVEGYGARSVLHSARLLRLSEDLPMVIEIVENQERLAPYLEKVETILDEAGCGGLITFEKVQIVRFTPGKNVPE